MKRMRMASFGLILIKSRANGDYFYIIKLSNDVVNDIEDDKVGYYCGDGLNELLFLFKDDNKQDFWVLRVSSYSSKV